MPNTSDEQDLFRVIHYSDTEISVLHEPSSFIFHFAVKDGALAPSPGLLHPIPDEAQVYLSGARGTAIAFLRNERSRDTSPQ
jgi:hypothetical protein